jgi:PAS domain S-box-containing protein
MTGKMDYSDRSKEEILVELLELQKSFNSFRIEHDNDISRLRQAEAELSKSEEKFRKALMTSPDSVNINRMSDGMYVSVNDGFCRILGYSEQDVLGKTSLELNIWANQEDRQELVKLLKANGIVENFEAYFRHKDGSLVIGLMSASLIELDGIPHLLNVTKDITSRKQVEEALSREQFILKALLDNLPDHLYFKDRESRFIRNSKSHALSFGLSDPDQLRGKSDFDFFSKDAANKAFEDEKEIMSTGKYVSMEEQLTRKDNSVAWFSAVKLPLRDNDGNIIGTFGISRDITELKRRELESHILFEITQGMTTTDNLEELLKLIHRSLGKVVYAENCFIALHNQKTGLFSFPYFIDKIDSAPLTTSMSKSCSAYVFRTVKPFLFNQKEYDRLIELDEVELVGSPSPSWIGVPLQTPSKVIGVLVLQHYELENVYSEDDLKFLISVAGQIAISIERKQAEEEIKLKNELLQSTNAEKDKFFSILAHDLRGPLSAFVEATQILTEEIQTMNIEEIREISVSMKTSASNIYSLLENLLEWSRLQRGVMEFVPETLNLKDSVIQSIEVLSESARKKKIEVTISVPDEMNIFADHHMFDTVIRNLVSNAIKFTRTGGKINVMSHANDDKSIMVQIVDSGIGMKPDLLKNLFHINGKTSRQGTEGETSTGLGLLLCKEFIEKHNGKIAVESEFEKGSIFSITLPRNN